MHKTLRDEHVQNSTYICEDDAGCGMLCDGLGKVADALRGIIRFLPVRWYVLRRRGPERRQREERKRARMPLLMERRSRQNKSVDMGFN